MAGPSGRPSARWRTHVVTCGGARVLLDERPRRLVELLDDVPDDGSTWADVEDLLSPWPTAAEDSRLLRAVALAHWRRAHVFCARCGTPLVATDTGRELVCSAGHRERPRLDCAVIMLITDGDPGAAAERCLLGRRAGTSEPRYSTLAGFYEPGECAEDAVRREVAEESGVIVGEVRYFSSQSWPMPTSLMLGYVGRATSTQVTCNPVELLDARWFTRGELVPLVESGEVVLPGTHTLARALIEQWRGPHRPSG